MMYPYENLENFTLPALLKRSLQLYSSEPCVAKVGQRPIDYEEFGKQVSEMSHLLLKNNIRPGDKVVLLSENMPNWSIAYFATTSFGAIITPVLPDFHPSDVHRILEHSQAKAAFVSSKHIGTIKEYTHDHLEFAVELDTLEMIDELSTRRKSTLMPEEIPQPSEDDMASLIYTSGTTGNSKGVMLSHRNICTNALSAYKHFDIKKYDKWLSMLPLAHTFECTVGMIIPILHGCSIYYIDKMPTPSVLLKAFNTVKPTMMVSVPLIIEKIYKSKILPQFTGSLFMRVLYDIPFFRKIFNKIAGKKLIETFGGELRFFGIGGAGISPYVENFLVEAKFPFIIGYGLTETAPLLTGWMFGKKIKPQSAGLPMPGVEIKIVDKNEQSGHGEIIARSPSIMMGYYKDKEKTDEVIKDGWFYTGDLGYVDDDGYLFISGRSKNVLIGPGGENIYPEQIEAVINQDESIVDSLVMHNKDGQLIALVHLDDEKLNDDELNDKEQFLEEMRQNVNSQISSFSRMTKFIEEKEPFIKTPTKKIKRFLYADR